MSTHQILRVLDSLIVLYKAHMIYYNLDIESMNNRSRSPNENQLLYERNDEHRPSHSLQNFNGNGMKLDQQSKVIEIVTFTSFALTFHSHTQPLIFFVYVFHNFQALKRMDVRMKLEFREKMRLNNYKWNYLDQHRD